MTSLVPSLPLAWQLPLDHRTGGTVARRDDVWLRDLYTSQWTAMVRLASLLLGSSDRAEEIVQDALLAVYQRRQKFETQSHAAAYLRAAVVNRTRSAHRHREVARRYRSDPQPGPVTPEQNVLDAETVAEVMAALDKLPRRQREVLVLRYYSEASEHDIAETLGISRGAVKSHAHRGVQALRKHLEAGRHHV